MTAAPDFFDAAVMTVASRSMTIQPVSRLPATVSQGKPPGRRCSRLHTCRRTRARAFAIRARVASSRAASVRRAVESEAANPNNGR
ncbi:hypothetical protein [Streptomyces sp. NPDC059176]|uniref:hypothetical protein n=1 Tax=Streptomyces sp. NPDC059176 TaxID=3346758 RepID=UPI0036A9EC79